MIHNRLLRFIVAARYIQDGYAILGSGYGIISGRLAALMRDRVRIIFDSGIVAPPSGSNPISVSDSSIVDCDSFISMGDCLGALLTKGVVKTAVIGAAQIDKSAQLNSSYVEGQRGRVRRLPGIGGASSIVRAVDRLIVIVDHEERRFCDECFYVSSNPFLERDECDYFFPVSRCKEVVVVTDKGAIVSSGQDCFEIAEIMPDCSYSDFSFVPGLRINQDAVSYVDEPSVSELDALKQVLGTHGSKWNVLGRRSSRI